MQRERLSPDRIRRFTCPKDVKQAFLRDTDAPRLAVRATTGARSFVFEGKLNRRTIRVTIGDVRAWNLDAARAEARRLETQLDQGIDPRQEKAERIAAAEAKQEEARRTEAPALEAWVAYLEARAVRWSPRTLLDHQRLSDPGGKPKTRGRKKGEGDTTQPGILLPILARPLKQIDAPAVRAFLKDDCQQREQLRPWFDAVRALPAVPSVYLQALLLTGARREELAGLRWEDVDFKWQSLRIADKVEGQRTIPLTPYVAALLRDLKRRNDTPPPEWRILHGQRIRNDLGAWEPSPWVFASKTAASGRLQEPRAAHNRALAAAGLPALSLHGLRRSFGTLAEWVECPAGVSAQIMGHKPSALAEKYYRRRPLDLLRMWHAKIEAWILEQAGIEQTHQEQAAPALRVVA